MSYRKECRKLKEELEAQSVCALFSNETLFRTQHKLQRKEAELMQAKVQIIELQKLLKEKKGRTWDSSSSCIMFWYTCSKVYEEPNYTYKRTFRY
jgi:hypothetical protein